MKVKTEEDIQDDAKENEEEAEGAVLVEPGNGLFDFDGRRGYFDWVRDAVVLGAALCCSSPSSCAAFLSPLYVMSFVSGFYPRFLFVFRKRISEKVSDRKGDRKECRLENKG